MRGPPSDTGIDPEEVNRLYFLSQRKRKGVERKRGRERKKAEKYKASQSSEIPRRVRSGGWWRGEE